METKNKMYVIANNKVAKGDYGIYAIVNANNEKEALHNLAEYYRTSKEYKWMLKDCDDISSDKKVIESHFGISNITVKEIKNGIWEGERA